RLSERPVDVRWHELDLGRGEQYRLADRDLRDEGNRGRGERSRSPEFLHELYRHRRTPVALRRRWIRRRGQPRVDERSVAIRPLTFVRRADGGFGHGRTPSTAFRVFLGAATGASRAFPPRDAPHSEHGFKKGHD